MARRHTIRTAALAAIALLFAPALLGCTAESSAESSAEAASDQPSVIAPGRPGEDARTLSPDEAREAAEEQREDANAADIDFMAMMVVHHQQALDMAGLVADQAADQRVQRLGARIEAVQAPEIAMMEAWLEEHGDESGHGHSGHHGGHGGHGQDEHDHAGMPGMASPEQLEALGEARGADFDALFLDLMIVHHEGAVTMSTEVLTEGADLTVSELATEIAAQQSAEVGRMRTLHADL